MDDYSILQKKLESALEIIMEHFHETEERIEALETKIEELSSGVFQDVDE